MSALLVLLLAACSTPPEPVPNAAVELAPRPTRLAAGDPVPDVEVVTGDGVRASLAALDGPTLLVFADPRCGRCRRWVGELAARSGRLSALGVEPLLVSDATDWGLPWRAAPDPDRHVRTAFHVVQRTARRPEAYLIVDGTVSWSADRPLLPRRADDVVDDLGAALAASRG